MWWRYDGICSSFRGLDGPDSSMSLFLFPPDHLNGILLLKNTRVSRVKLMWGFDTRLTNLWCFYLSLSWLYLIDYKTEALLWAGQSLPSAQTWDRPDILMKKTQVKRFGEPNLIQLRSFLTPAMFPKIHSCCHHALSFAIFQVNWTNFVFRWITVPPVPF